MPAVISSGIGFLNYGRPVQFPYTIVSDTFGFSSGYASGANFGTGGLTTSGQAFSGSVKNLYGADFYSFQIDTSGSLTSTWQVILYGSLNSGLSYKSLSGAIGPFSAAGLYQTGSSGVTAPMLTNILPTIIFGSGAISGTVAVTTGANG